MSVFFCNDGISAYPIKFDDKEGFWFCNLWYSNASLLDFPIQFSSEENMIDKAHHFFLLLRHKKEQAK